MTPLFTVNLLRVLFVTFCGVIGASISSELLDSTLPGLLVGFVLGLLVVLVDRLLKGISLRAFSSATFGLLLGLIFASLLSGSQVLRFQSDTVQWSLRLVVYVVFAYFGMMLAMRSNRDEFSLIIPYVRCSRETAEHDPLAVDTRALRPIVLAGDEMELHLVKEGRDPNQAVGYLPDGTMIVINHARSLIGKTVKIVVSSTLQTAGGRLIFGELKPPAAASA